MFLRKDTEMKRTGTVVVPFCLDCGSQEIETIQTCKCCGSHNINSDWSDIRSQRLEFTKIEIPIYKCDKCGKEFDGFEVDSNLSYSDGCFQAYEGYSNCSIDYSIEADLCNDCKQELIRQLNLDLNKIIDPNNVADRIYKFIKGGNK